MAKDIIKKLISYNKTEEAIAVLKDFTFKDSTLNNRVVELSSQYYKTKEEALMGDIDRETETTERNRINKALLFLLQKIDQTVVIWGHLEVLEGPDKGMVYRLFTPMVSIGRDRNNHIQLRDPKVSNLHGNIISSTQGITYVHLSQSKPSLIRGVDRGAKLEANRLKNFQLRSQDVIHIGETKLQIQLAAGVEAPKIDATVL